MSTIERESKASSSPTSTISSDGPLTPESASLSSCSSSSPSHASSTKKTQPQIPLIRSFGGLVIAPLHVPSSNTASSLHPTSSLGHDHEPYTPSVYSPQTPLVPAADDNTGLGMTTTTRGGGFHLGWGEGGGDEDGNVRWKIIGEEEEEEEEEVSPPAPLDVRKSSIEKQHLVFNPECIPKPTFYDLEKPYGGTKHFMMAHGLRYYDQDDCDIRREILEQLKDLEWRNRVNTAREEFVRMNGGGKVRVE